MDTRLSNNSFGSTQDMVREALTHFLTLSFRHQLLNNTSPLPSRLSLQKSLTSAMDGKRICMTGDPSSNPLKCHEPCRDLHGASSHILQPVTISENFYGRKSVIVSCWGSLQRRLHLLTTRFCLKQCSPMQPLKANTFYHTALDRLAQC